jgi:4-hydroxythreonine-4-phosphate dehydrogenase
MSEVLALADDLSGALETAGLALRLTDDVVIAHSARSASLSRRVVVIDTDSRDATPVDAARAVTDALAPADWVIKKIDSLLRGNVASEIGALRDAGRAVILAAALPALGRTVRDGRVHVDGSPLSTSPMSGDYWAGATDSVARAVAAPCDVIGLPVVRADAASLAHRIESAFLSGAVAVCDGETDADLDAIVTASRLLPRDWRRHLAFAGSGGIAGAVFRALDPGENPHTTAQGDGGSPRRRAVARPGAATLIISATTAPVLAPQLARLGPDLHAETVDAALLLAERGSDAAAARSTQLAELVGRHPLLAITVAATSPHLQGRGREIAGALAQVAASASSRVGNLILIGGSTARHVLDATGILTLQPMWQAHYGAVVSRAETGQFVTVRPGSFGDIDSLRTIVAALRQPQPQRQGSTHD